MDPNNVLRTPPSGAGGQVGIYIHIPFCKQACHYCDFHFSTTMGKKEEMVKALCKELELRKAEFLGEQVATIYFGGGTPSVLETEEIEQLITVVREYYDVVDNPEITLEANPDDLSEEKILQLVASPINRLSIGIQSFFEEDLKLMNRAHNALEAEKCLQLASEHFDNISIDLIYGMPNMTLDRWKQNIDKALGFGIPHISSYALTVEPKTALAKFVEDGLITPATDEETQEHFNVLNETLLSEGFDCYEISNFGKPGYYSQNNSAYWQQKKYIGVGPSAHSFDGVQRGWNINNNPKYIKSIAQNIVPMEVEVLSSTDKYNEYVMTGLRTIWGVSLSRISTEFGPKYKEYVLLQADKFIEEHLLFVDGDILKTTKKGMFLADGIAADLFMVNLK
ncbi:radical SAM family heme chaperone HemW [Maribacter dokdonensis]|uniref:radical SAM family heme chaperone HemW n=1 Tax=Maribacter dokdonensis TaxID=320912 RepID=UPI001C08D956|nr:radical SAM family heme chaperone HemW [Maribacter dokdonensis]MBU2900260.1 radical SAM family heme chaperone HemW [Maribacter dokdonensis]